MKTYYTNSLHTKLSDIMKVGVEVVIASEAMAEIAAKDRENLKLKAAISVWKATHDLLKQEIAELKADNERLKGEAAAWEKSTNIEWEQAEEAINKLSRLTAALKDDERAERVDFYDTADSAISVAYPGVKRGYWGVTHIPNYGILRGAIEKAIREAINDYRAEMLKEVL